MTEEGKSVDNAHSIADPEATEEEVVPSRAERLGRGLLQFDDALARLVRRLWNEATDHTNLMWPPMWLKAAGAILAIGLALGLIVPIGQFMGLALTALGFEALNQLSDIVTLQYLVLTVQRYLERSSAGLPIAPNELLAIWQLAGVLFFVASLVGSRGARVGWTLFGFLTAAIVWAETLPTGRWVAAGLVLISWAVLSIFTFGRSPLRKPNQRGSRTRSTASSSTDELEARAEKSARRLGYSDLANYLDEKGSARIDTIARELRIPKSKVSRLRSEYLPPWISFRSRSTPAKQKLIVMDYRGGDMSKRDIREKHNLSTSEFNALIKRYHSYQAGRE